jgi:hypothetical protein
MDRLKPSHVLISAVHDPAQTVITGFETEARFILVEVDAKDPSHIAVRFDAGLLKTCVATMPQLNAAITTRKTIDGRSPQASGTSSSLPTDDLPAAVKACDSPAAGSALHMQPRYVPCRI